MHFSHLHYLPLSLPFFSILIGVFLLLLIFIQLRILRYAYMRLGLSSGGALLLLLGSLIGSYFNIPVAQLAGQQAEAGQEITFFGMQYVIPVLVDWPGTIIAVNVGGAVIPTVVSIYLIARHQLVVKGTIAIVC